MARMVVHEQNSGFSLIELLVAIAILSMLTVPLMNSFIMSGKINRNSRRLQDAAAVAQSVMETAKHTTDKAALEAALKSVPGVYEFPAESKADDESPVYSFKLDGADGEKFRINVNISPKTDYNYKSTQFADLYNEAGVIYRELILNDNKVLSLMKSMTIPYYNPSEQSEAPEYAPTVQKWQYNKEKDKWGWSTIYASDADMAIRDTYGNLFADEYLKTNTLFDDISESELTDIYSGFKKENIDKQVDIGIAQDGDDYIVRINTAYFFEYSVVYRAEDLTAAPAKGGKKTPMAFYKCYGTLAYKADEITLTFDNDIPLYFLYAKAEGSSSASEDGTTAVKTADVRHFNSVTYNVIVDSGMNLADEDGRARSMELYFVEEAGTRQEDNFKINVHNESLLTELNLYTTEPYNIESIASTLFVMADGKGVNVYSTKDEKNTDKHIAYTKGDEITSLYKIVVSVEYDADRDGSYSEQVYSISTDD